jgi:hypothetical protein
MKRTTQINRLMDAVKHYQKTGKHKQVSIQYNPANRTQFDFASWKHSSDSDSVRKILPEDIRMSEAGKFYVVGKDNRRIEWETLVKALDSIDVMNVGRDLEKVSKMFTLTRWQEMSILAYIKILELMMVRAKETGALDGVVTPSMNPSDTSYTGSMFG